MNPSLQVETENRQPSRRRNRRSMTPVRRPVMSPVRRPSMGNSNNSSAVELQLEDKVHVQQLDVQLQGLVAYIGRLDGEKGTWVGVQLTGPSIGLGNTDGTFNGRRYFANVGARNGVLVPRKRVQRRDNNNNNAPTTPSRRPRSRSMSRGRSPAKRRQPSPQKGTAPPLETFLASPTKRSTNPNSKRRSTTPQRSAKSATTNDVQTLDALFHQRHQAQAKTTSSSASIFSGTVGGAPLCPHDLELVNHLDNGSLKYCLVDVGRPQHKPVITYANEAFLEMMQCDILDILGKNYVVFLQQPPWAAPSSGTDTLLREDTLSRLGRALQQATECSLCLLQYRKDGSHFFVQLVGTPLRDIHGNVMHYLGVHCPVTAKHAMRRQNRDASAFPLAQRDNLDNFLNQQNGGNFNNGRLDHIRSCRASPYNIEFTEGNSAIDSLRIVADLQDDEDATTATSAKVTYGNKHGTTQYAPAVCVAIDVDDIPVAPTIWSEGTEHTAYTGPVQFVDLTPSASQPSATTRVERTERCESKNRPRRQQRTPLRCSSRGRSGGDSSSRGRGRGTASSFSRPTEAQALSSPRRRRSVSRPRRCAREEDSTRRTTSQRTSGSSSRRRSSSCTPRQTPRGRSVLTSRSRPLEQKSKPQEQPILEVSSSSFFEDIDLSAFVPPPSWVPNEESLKELFVDMSLPGN